MQKLSRFLNCATIANMIYMLSVSKFSELKSDFYDSSNLGSHLGVLYYHFCFSLFKISQN